MAYDFLDRLATPGVEAARVANGVGGLWERVGGDRASTSLTAQEAAFFSARDSFYLASTSQTGWPYIQHRGGPPGFLRVLDERTLGFADYRGNRQYLTLGAIADDDRVALFLMDYPRRRRLKILAHMTAHDLAAEPDLAARLATPGYRGVAERAFMFRLEAFDWNCPQHITPRFTAAEIEAASAPLRERIIALEAENARLRAEEKRQ
ncbi:pyridoxamine 5'-phosphate oxidase family protein [Sphingopyxis sp. EG6]|uniref:pyridoxamine 5'-phosphate oxidase family protein n=1 Tax=Sphingopyxis sp. EG6 TaxID=1874061 RepID=UPI000DC63314|nr:pyridoxamine 5'-phosphate oxidase family protein [Sphingopyxis sp. EG6]MEA3264712.1 pyridoxamine 5'-phosphate oxidase family protein [Pseudomonadota bacterium]BBB08509.1 pyridoxamine 5'-phosphate oxidase-like FMN-binding protein [Sphingopyxis sp. EG6]